MCALLHRFAGTISAHAWNADHSMLAICPNSPEIRIYSNCKDPDPKNWTLSYTLKQHDMVVSGIDWCPKTNKIASCSHDRNAFVWTYEEETDTWQPTLVVLRINRGATAIQWSPDGSKFAVSSSAKMVAVCYYEPSNYWWVAQAIKKHKATVTSIAWHPNSQLLATSSCDGRVRLFTAFLEENEEEPADGPFGPQESFGDLLLQFEHSKTWVNDLAFSPDGQYLSFVTHGSEIYVLKVGPEENPNFQISQHSGLPYNTVSWLSPKCIVAAGHDFKPALYSLGADYRIKFEGYVDKSSEKKSLHKSNSSFSSARAMFASRVNKGEDAPSDKDQLTTKHEAAITDLKVWRDSVEQNASTFSTSGLDGRVVVWKLKDLELSLNLKDLSL